MRVLFVPALRRGMGSGHLRRTGELAGRLGPDAAVLLAGCREELGLAPVELLTSLGLGGAKVRYVERFDSSEQWDLVVLDRRVTGRSDLARFAGFPLVGFDEGGFARAYAGCVIDLLPTPPGLPAPNRFCMGLLLLQPAAAAGSIPPGKQPSSAGRQHILLSFGGEDPADLTGRMIAALSRGLAVPAETLTVVQGALFDRTEWPSEVRVLRRPPRLAELLKDYDLVFTSFGLTTFEALAAGVPVVNLNPSRYHRRLSRAAGIPEIGVRRPRMRALRRCLSDPKRSRPSRQYPAEAMHPIEDLAGFFDGLRPDADTDCPVCRTRDNPALARFQRRTYFRCRICGIIYLVGFGLEPKLYTSDYFGEEYRLQYGRTYLEDFEAIKAAGKRRLGMIRRRLRRRQDTGAVGRRLLDVGCAYGPFLAAARDMGFECEGIDVSASAVGYVRDTLRIPCRLGDFEDPSLELWPDGTFDVVSLWYVIEHFRNPALVLGRAARLLRPGGILAFSTPNVAGISGRRNPRAFLDASPTDHRTLWSPRVARRIAGRFGLASGATVVTGHHPERFPWPGGGLAVPVGSDPAGPARWVGLASRAFRLGDTFELYAARRGERA